jgi:N-acetylmuramoyl-L-alanine amidase
MKMTTSASLLLPMAILGLGCGGDASAHRAAASTTPHGDSPVATRSLLPRSARPQPADTPTIVVDPGHPSETSGGTVQHGVAEVHVAWLVALRLRDLLRADGYRVVLTKQRENEMVRNADRARIANRAGAELMVRLHCDATNGSGYTLYYPNRQGTVGGITGPSDTVIRKSRAAAAALHTGMSGILGGRLRDGGLRGDSETYVGSRQGALTGSIFSRVPVVTIEMVVLGARSDAEFISGTKGQDLMAHAIAEGVRRYVPRVPGGSGSVRDTSAGPPPRTDSSAAHRDSSRAANRSDDGGVGTPMARGEVTLGLG